MKRSYFRGIIAFAFMALICTTANAQFGSWLGGSGKRVTASGNYVNKEYRVDDFKGFDLACSADVVYTQKSGKPTVKIYVSDNIAEILDVKVTGGTLKIAAKRGYYIRLNNTKFQVELSSETLENIGISGSGTVKVGKLDTNSLGLSISGSGDIDCNNVVSRGALSTRISGSGDIDMKNVQSSSLTSRVTGSGEIDIENIKTGKAEAIITGSGDIDLQGTATDATYSITGSGDISAKELHAANVEASVTGSGDITCYASEYLRASSSGSGSIGYAGKPKKTDIPRRRIHEID